ncbi:MAG: phosphotransferase family protein [Acidimicrobiales bacterium]
MTAAPALDDRVDAWLTSRVGLAGPLRATLIAGGRSNLTYRVEDADGRTVVLRRPPASHVLPTAHDMAREYRIIAALRPQGVPVPEALALCTDPAVAERPFYVMEFVDGLVLRDREQAERALAPETRAGVGDHLAETLAALHDVDVDRAGLGDLARREGYVERQIHRWLGQYEQMREGHGADGVIDVGRRLAASIPPAQRTTVVHGDYRLDNTVLSPAGAVRAILDWEICTLGDPLADVGLLLDYWAEPGDDVTVLLGAAPTTAPGFATRAEVLASYASRSPLDLGAIAFYQAFGFWKLACILQGVYTRYRAGATGGDPGAVTEFPTHVATLAQRARDTLET